MDGFCHDKLNGPSTGGAYERLGEEPGMIDTFALALSHGLMLLAAWRLLARPDLDDPAAEPPPPPATKPRGFGKAAPGA